MTTVLDRPSAPTPGGAHPIESLPSIVLRRAVDTSDRIALREKDRGRWVTYDWATYAARMTTIARGLAALGVHRGDRVAVHSENRPEWLFAEDRKSTRLNSSH